MSAPTPTPSGAASPLAAGTASPPTGQAQPQPLASSSISVLMARGFSYDQVAEALLRCDGREEEAAFDLFKQQHLQAQQAQHATTPGETATGADAMDTTPAQQVADTLPKLASGGPGGPAMAPRSGDSLPRDSPPPAPAEVAAAQPAVAPASHLHPAAGPQLDLQAQIAAAVQAGTQAAMRDMQQQMLAQQQERAKQEQERLQERAKLEAEIQALKLANAAGAGAGAGIGAGRGAPSSSFALAVAKPPAHPWSRILLSPEQLNQYSVGSVSGCTVMALEGSLQILSGAPLSGELVTDILAAGSCYASDLHTGLSEILPHVDRYSERLEVLSESQAPIAQFGELVQEMAALARERRAPIAAMLTKPPESVLLCCDPTPGSAAPFLLFDSHKRPWHDGAAFVTFASGQALTRYVTEYLFPREGGGGDDGERSLAEELYFIYEATMLVAKSSGDAVPDPRSIQLSTLAMLKLRGQLAGVARTAQAERDRYARNRAEADKRAEEKRAEEKVVEEKRAAEKRAADQAWRPAPAYKHSPPRPFGAAAGGGGGGGAGAYGAQPNGWKLPPAQHAEKGAQQRWTWAGDDSAAGGGIRPSPHKPLYKGDGENKENFDRDDDGSTGGGQPNVLSRAANWVGQKLFMSGWKGQGQGQGAAGGTHGGAGAAGGADQGLRSQMYGRRPRNPDQWFRALKEFMLAAVGAEGMLAAHVTGQFRAFHGYALDYGAFKEENLKGVLLRYPNLVSIVPGPGSSMRVQLAQRLAGGAGAGGAQVAPQPDNLPLQHSGWQGGKRKDGNKGGAAAAPAQAPAAPDVHDDAAMAARLAAEDQLELDQFAKAQQAQAAAVPKPKPADKAKGNAAAGDKPLTAEQRKQQFALDRIAAERLQRELEAEDAADQAANARAEAARRAHAEAQLAVDAALAASMVVPTFECPFCIEEVPEDDKYTPVCCQRSKCRFCMRRSIISLLDELKMPTCDCKVQLSEDDLALFLTEAEFRRYQNLSIASLAQASDEEWLSCNTPDCKVRVIGDEQTTHWQCVGCQARWCAKCDAPWHQDQLCEQFRQTAAYRKIQEDVNNNIGQLG